MTDPNEIQNVITKFSFATKGGIAASNPYKQNQDAYLTNPHILGLRHCHFFAVCDGHGTNGREVSNYMKHNLPQKIESNLRINRAIKNHTDYPDYNTIKQSIHSAFEQTNDGVFHQLGVDIRFSGSTCVSVMTFGTKLFVANVGDSRAVLISKNANTPEGFQVTALTRDHKPCDPDEGRRIIEAGGRIDSYRD